MIGVLTGFGIIGAIILLGYIIGRTDLLGTDPRAVLSRLVFFVLSPCLLFTVLAEADVATLFSSVLVVSAIAAITSAGLFVLVATLIWRRKLPEVVIGGLASGYVNANNIGIPVAVYVLGDAALPAPVILLQLLVLAPIALTILDLSTTGKLSLSRILLQPVRNPLIIASLLGVIVSVTGLQIPAPVMAPFQLVGAATVPLVLIGFGISLHGQKVFQPGSGRKEIALATAIKLVLMPVVAWVAGTAFGLSAESLHSVVVLAALPSAQNVFNYAQRYGRGEVIARDAVLLSTIGAVPALLVISLLLV
ncbi:AEC family transporter [Naasia lichenicola]|uniref:AEC family transporter n=1 Tax=Naasia lichenicola TaxID=2565933 RepID=A0A4S4FHM6_9MICO|nr:AEC family transporter [Naasia lichenicola]THG29528.1 AEC family transporter [Naasia lichenicola]